MSSVVAELRARIKSYTIFYKYEYTLFVFWSKFVCIRFWLPWT